MHPQVTYSPICTGEKFRIGHVGPYKGGKKETTPEWLTMCANLETENFPHQNRSPLIERIYGASRHDHRAPGTKKRAPGIENTGKDDVHPSSNPGDPSYDSAGIRLFSDAHTHKGTDADSYNNPGQPENHRVAPRDYNSGADLYQGNSGEGHGGTVMARTSDEKNGGKQGSSNATEQSPLNKKKCVIVGIPIRKNTTARILSHV
jgi:hypothetical protein